MTNFILAILFVCLYVHSAVSHGPARSLIPRRRAFRPMVFPIQSQRRPLLTLRPFPGISRQMILHKKYKNMLRMRSSKVLHKLKTKKGFMKKPRFFIKGPRLPTARPLGPRSMNIAIGGARRFGRRPLPMFSPRIPQIIPFAPMFGSPPQMPRIVNRRMGPVPRFRDDFSDFDDNDFNDRGGDDFKSFDDIDDKGGSFDSRFTDGFGSSAGRPIPVQTSGPGNNFGRSSTPAFPPFGGRFELGVASSVSSDGPLHDANPIPFPGNDRRQFPIINQPFPRRFPDFDDLGDRFNRIPDFDDSDLKPSVPGFVENVLDNQKDFNENIRDDFKRDDNFPIIGRGDHRQFMPVLNDETKREEGVPDLLDIDNIPNPGVINGFEMLGSRQRDTDSNIRSILKDNPFEQLGDPVLLDQLSDDSDKSSDDSPAGTFALLGIDPGTVQSFQNEDKTMGIAPTSQDVPRPGSIPGLPVDWAMDLGFSVDKEVKKDAISKDIPPPSRV